MDYLHNELKIVHRDLKGRNVYLNQEEDYRIKAVVGNFNHSLHSLSRVNDSKQYEVGSYGWMVRCMIF